MLRQQLGDCCLSLLQRHRPRVDCLRQLRLLRHLARPAEGVFEDLSAARQEFGFTSSPSPRCASSIFSAFGTRRSSSSRRASSTVGFLGRPPSLPKRRRASASPSGANLGMC
jgi:hypothetical protein